MNEGWSYEQGKALVAYNRAIRKYKVLHPTQTVEADGRYVENHVPPRKCRWCLKDLMKVKAVLVCLTCDRVGV